MDNIANKRSCTTADCNLIGKTSQHAFCDTRIARRVVFKQQRLGVRYIEKLVEKFTHLPCGVRVNTQGAALIHSKIPRTRPLKHTHEDEKIGGSTAKSFAPLLLDFFIHPEKHRAGLCEGGDQSCRSHAPQLIGGNKHAGVPRMHWKAEHPPSNGGDLSLGI